MAAGIAAVLMLVAVVVRTSVDVDEDVAAARAGRASIPTLVAKICKGRIETGAEDAVVARGLPALPALFRAQVRIEKDGAECSLHPAELIERIVSAADAKKRGPAISFMFRALTSHDRAEVEAALSTIMSLDGGIWWSGEEKPPSPAMEKLLVPAVGPVWRLVRDGQGTLRAEALDAMATLGRLFTAHLSDLEALLDDPSARPDALGAIERLGPAAASLGPALRRRLRSERDGDWTRRYAEVLQKLGSAARDALPDLWAALRDPASRSCGDRAYQIDRLARVVLAVDLDLRASASEGGATALAAALDAAFRASLLCRSSVTDDLDEMLRRLPSRYITATLRARISDGDLSLRYRSRAAETLTMVGASLSPDEEAERRLLVELANPSEDRGTTLAGALARCRRQGGRAAPPAPMSPPRPQLWSSELDPDEAAAFCLAERLCGPGDARYRRAVDIVADTRMEPVRRIGVEMRPGSAVLPLAAVLMAISPRAAADDPPVVTDARDLRSARQAEARWRATGAASVPEALRAYCGSDSEALAAAGKRQLRAVGLPAVVPLATVTPKRSRSTCSPSELAVEILCQVERPDTRVLDAAVDALARLDARRPARARAETLVEALTFGKRMKQPCPNQAVLARAAVASIAARARAIGRGDERFALAGLLEAAGPEAAPLVSTLGAWLADGDARVSLAAARSLAHIGPGAAATVVALRDLIARWRTRPSGGGGSFGADYPREEALTAAIEALGAIGPGARGASPALAELLAAEIDHLFEGHHGEVVVALLRALPRTAPGTPSMVEDVRRLLKRRSEPVPRPLADSRPSTVGVIGGPDVTWAEIVEAAGELGPAGRPLAPELAPFLANPRADARLRAAAAAALGKIGAPLSEPEELSRRVLVRRGAWIDEFERQVSDGAGWKDERHMPALVTEALNQCRADAGGAPLDGPGAFVGFAEQDNMQLARCLAPRPCGPERGALEATLATCCDYAYGDHRPAVCPPAPRWPAATPSARPSLVSGGKAVPPTRLVPIADRERPSIERPDLVFRGVWGAPRMNHPGGAIAARFRPDGTLVSVGGDGGARVWDVAGRRLRALTSGVWPDLLYGTRATISADGRWLATWRDRKAPTIAPVDGGPVFELSDARDVQALAFGPGVVACLARFGSNDRELRIYGLKSGRVQAGIDAREAEAVALSPDGQRVVLAGNGWARAWKAALDDFPLWARTDLPPDHTGACWNDRGAATCPPSPAFLPDGRLLLGSGSELQILDAASGRTATRLVGLYASEQISVEDVTPSADGRWAVSLTRREAPVLRFWDLVAGRETARLGDLRSADLVPRALRAVRGVAFSPAGDLLVVASDVELVPLDAGSHLVPARAGSHEGTVSSLAFTPDGTRLLTASEEDGSVRLWEVAARRELWRWRGPPDRFGHPERVEITPAGDAALVAGLVDATMIDLASGHTRWQLVDRSYGGWARLSPDGASVASYGAKDGLCLHRAADGTRIWCHGSALDGGAPLTFSPDGGALIGSGLVDGRRATFAWDLKTGKPLHPLAAGGRSPGLVSARDASGAVLYAPLERMVPLNALPGAGHEFPKGLLRALALSPDGQALAAADERGALHIVRMGDGQEVNRITFPEDVVQSAAWSPDGKRLLLGTGSGALVELAGTL